MPFKVCIAVACLITIILSLNVNLVYSLEFGKQFDNSEIPLDELRLSFDITKLNFKETIKGLFDDAGGKFVLKSPGNLDYLFLAYDVAKPIGSYLGYIGEKPLTRDELCKQLIGAGTAFVGSVGGASVGSYGGTLILPGWGTAIGGILGGNIGYSLGNELGIEVIGEIIC